MSIDVCLSLTKPNLYYVIITCFPREAWHCQTFDIFLGKILNVNVLWLIKRQITWLN